MSIISIILDECQLLIFNKIILKFAHLQITFVSSFTLKLNKMIQFYVPKAIITNT